MAGPKLDGPGTIKLVTLAEAQTELQRVHALVERMASEVKSEKPIGGMTQQFKRVSTPLVGKLKGQFQLIADLVSGMLLIAGRGGGGDQAKVRAFREAVAQVRIQIEIAITQTKEKHAIKAEDEKTSE